MCHSLSSTAPTQNHFLPQAANLSAFPYTTALRGVNAGYITKRNISPVAYDRKSVAGNMANMSAHPARFPLVLLLRMPFPILCLINHGFMKNGLHHPRCSLRPAGSRGALAPITKTDTSVVSEEHRNCDHRCVRLLLDILTT